MHWYLDKRGVKVHIDSASFPQEDEVAFDIETDEKDNCVSLAVCGNANEVFVYFYPSQEIFDKLATKKLIGHQARADVRWAAKYGITMKHIVWDTMLADYVIASTQDSFGLKELAWKWLSFKWPSYPELTTSPVFMQAACEENPALMIFKVRKFKTKPDRVDAKFPKKLTLDKMPKVLVANYNAWDAYATFMLKRSQVQRATPTARAYMEKIEFPTSQLLYEVENKGIKVDMRLLVLTHKKFLKKMYRAKRLFADKVGKDVLVSSHVQVLKALKKIDKRIPSTNEDALQPFKFHREVKLLLAFRGFAKICNTYTKVLYKKAKASPDGRVHCDFLQHTETGRLASRKPNLQNQPPEVRACFIAEVGNAYCNGDWSQIELRVPAHYSMDQLMVENFVQAKEKFHAMTARKINKPYKVGKTVNFLLTNGGGPKRLSEMAGITEPEAVDVFDTHKREFSGYWSWVDNQKAAARQNGGMTTLYGRFVPLPDLRHTDFKIRGYTERLAISIKVQGSAADMMKAAMIKIWRLYGLVPVVTVHDELMYEDALDKIADVEVKVKGVMESIVRLNVPLVADIGVGSSWATAKKKD